MTAAVAVQAQQTPQQGGGNKPGPALTPNPTLAEHDCSSLHLGGRDELASTVEQQCADVQKVSIFAHIA